MNNESYDFEDRKYINPTLSRDEQLAFVDKFRGIQQQDMNKIARDTHNLGTDVPSIEGGLSGSEGMWANQYVNPKVDSMVSGLRATAQAQALNDVLSNYQSQMQKRYNDAYRAAQLRGNAGSGDGTGSNGDDDEEIDYKPSDNATPDSQDNIDTVSSHTGTKQYSNPNAPEGSLPSIAGGQLPSSGGAVYYLVSPDGKKTQIVVNKNMSGTYMDTPVQSVGGSDNIANYLSNYIKRGYQIQLKGGQNITPTYRITMGL